MAEVLRCRDRWGRVIVVDRDQWVAKCLQHPELQDDLEALEKTLIDPWEVTYDRKHLDRECFYRPFVLQSPFNKSWLKVCVEFSASRLTGQETGWFVTAFSRSEIHPDEEVKWSSIERQ